MADTAPEATENGTEPENATMQDPAQDFVLPEWIHSNAAPYTSVGKPDPFVSFVKIREYEAMQAALKAKAEKKSISPLENVDTNALKVVAIMQAGDNSKLAMIELPDGKGYLIHPGTVVGLYDGVVTSIEQEAIVVQESVVDVFGEPKTRTINLRLRKEKE